MQKKVHSFSYQKSNIKYFYFIHCIAFTIHEKKCCISILIFQWYSTYYKCNNWMKTVSFCLLCWYWISYFSVSPIKKITRCLSTPIGIATTLIIFHKGFWTLCRILFNHQLQHLCQVNHAITNMGSSVFCAPLDRCISQTYQDDISVKCRSTYQLTFRESIQSICQPGVVV